MTELYLHIKIYLDYFPGRLKHAELGKPMRLIWVSVPKVVEVIPLYLNPVILHRFIYKTFRVYDLIERNSLYFKIYP